MQDNFNDFDLQIRSMLEDAEVKPSRRVWKEVSSRLDTSTATETPYLGWYRWAGAALATAAVALGVFFVGTRIDNTQEPQLLALADSAESVEAAPESNVPVGPIFDFRDAEEDLRSSQGEAIESIAPSEGLRVQAAAGYSVQEGQTGTEEVQASADDSGTAAKSSPRRWQASPDKADKPAPEYDAFAGVTEDDRQLESFGKTSLFAQGSLGGNDSDFGISGRSSSYMAPGSSSSGITENSTSTYGIPFTLSIGARVYLLPRLSIGSGVDYSLLTRTFSGSYSGEYEGETIEDAGSFYHQLQYVGIPLNIYYDVLSAEKIKFYVYGGGEIEWCVSNKYTLLGDRDISLSEPVDGPQTSVALGLGVEFALSDLIGLYIDPGVKYYFQCDQPKSVRTDRPLLANFNAGLRFNF